jgi:hypothetical protein
MRTVWHTIFTATGAWQYDDGNQTNLPNATIALTATRDYALPVDALTIQKVTVLNAAGEPYQIFPTSEDVIDPDLDDVGTPMTYKIIGRTIRLNRIPSWTIADGIKFYFDRGSVAFAFDDEDKAPGFATEYHDIIPLGASVKWLKVNQPTNPSLPALQQDYIRATQNLKEFYQKQYKAYKPVIARAYKSFK